MSLAPGPHETFGLGPHSNRWRVAHRPWWSRTSALAEIIADSGALRDNRPEAIAHAVRNRRRLNAIWQRSRKAVVCRNIYLWQHSYMLAALGAMAVSTRCGDITLPHSDSSLRRNLCSKSDTPLARRGLLAGVPYLEPAVAGSSTGEHSGEPATSAGARGENS